MKPANSFFFLVFCLSLAVCSHAQEADSTGLPGDNFSLQGALEMFKKASSPEEFEKLINEKDNGVNNLDLNEDGETDYIRVIDKSEKDAHVFVLQVPVSDKESQDIAVIELEKTGNETANIQIVGDEDIFGEETIVEPDGGGDESSYLINDNQFAVAHGPSAEYAPIDTRIVVNVWLWPAVRFVYRPAYTVWVSPWRYHYYPGWWRPWRPLGWYAYRPLRVRYYHPYVIVHTHRLGYAHGIYRPARVTSVTVRARHAVAVNNYRVTRRSTTVTGPRGNQVNRKTTTVRGPGGNTRMRSTKTTVRRRK
jgi:hypothetical protein